MYDTLSGMGGVGATDSGISKLWLPGDPSQLPVEAFPSELTDRAAQLLHNYFTGAEQSFDQIPLDISGLTLFQQHILTIVRSIPYGTVVSYGEIACIAGNNNGARAIGGALASNPIPIIIPCHRVVSSSGMLTGFTAPGGIRTKRALLEMEGIHFSGDKIAIKSTGFAQANI